jgi:hypothetical protein
MESPIDKEFRRWFGRDEQPGQLEAIALCCGPVERIRMLDEFDKMLEAAKPGSREYAEILHRKAGLATLHGNMARAGR